MRQTHCLYQKMFSYLNHKPFIQLPFPVERTGKTRSEDQMEQPFICSPKVTLPLIASDRLAESMLLFTVAR